MRRTFQMISIFVPYITIHIYTNHIYSNTTYYANIHRTYNSSILHSEPKKGPFYYSNYGLDLKIPYL